MPTLERARGWGGAAALMLVLGGGGSALAGIHVDLDPEVNKVVPHESALTDKQVDQIFAGMKLAKEAEDEHWVLPPLSSRLEPVGERYTCCKFVTKSKTSEVLLQRQIARTHFFDAKIDMAKVKIVTASSDSVAGRTIKTLPAERRHDGREWKTLDDARAAFKAHAAAVGGNGVMILLAHNDGEGRMHFEGRTGTTELKSIELVKVAKEEGVDLLVWGCQSADEVSGGAVQKFRLNPMVAALREAFKIADPTWGALLNSVTTATGIEFAFDPATLGAPGGFAAKLVPSAQANSADFRLSATENKLESVSFPNQTMIQALAEAHARARASVQAIAPVREPDHPISWDTVAITAGVVIAGGSLAFRMRRRTPSRPA